MTGAPASSHFIRTATSKATVAPMLCPKKASGRSISGRSAANDSSASSAIVVSGRSSRRSCRPGYCSATTCMVDCMASETG